MKPIVLASSWSCDGDWFIYKHTTHKRECNDEMRKKKLEGQDKTFATYKELWQVPLLQHGARCGLHKKQNLRDRSQPRECRSSRPSFAGSSATLERWEDIE